MQDKYKFVAANIKHYRKLKPLTQADLADKLGIKRSTYADQEKSGNFSDAEIAKAEKILGIPQGTLIKDLGLTPKTVKIEDVAATLLQNDIEKIALSRTILAVLAEMNAPGLKTSSKALSDIYRTMVKDEAVRVADEIQRK